MDGHFPFGNGLSRPQGQQPQQLTMAQMRAALGLLPEANEPTNSQLRPIFLQVPQAPPQQSLHPPSLQQDGSFGSNDSNSQLRQILLQEQIDHQLQEQQLRAISDNLQDFPDLQQHYRRLLLNERFIQDTEHDQIMLRHQQHEQQQQQRAALPKFQFAGGASPSEQLLSLFQQQQREQLQHQQQQTQQQLLQRQQQLQLQQQLQQPQLTNMSTNPAAFYIPQTGPSQAAAASGVGPSPHVTASTPMAFDGKGNNDSIYREMTTAGAEKLARSQETSESSTPLSYTKGLAEYSGDLHGKTTKKAAGDAKDKSKDKTLKKAPTKRRGPVDRKADPFPPAPKRPRGRPRKSVPSQVDPSPDGPLSAADGALFTKKPPSRSDAADMAAKSITLASPPGKKPPPRPPTVPALPDRIIPPSKQKKSPMASSHLPLFTPNNASKLKKKKDKAVAGVMASELMPPPSPPDRTAEDVLQSVVYAADLATPQIIRRGTVDGLLQAAQEGEQVDQMAHVLTLLKSSQVEPNVKWNDDAVVSTHFRMTRWCGMDDDESLPPDLPLLPEEPEYHDPLVFVTSTAGRTTVATPMALVDAQSAGAAGVAAQPQRVVTSLTAMKAGTALSSPLSTDAAPKKSPKKKKRHVMDYSYPIDTWWPAVSSIQKERHEAGETTDEDDFKDSFEGLDSQFRVNASKLKVRLATEPRPGVLEKLPHCQLHRLHSTFTRKGTSMPELAFCFQVTELYPNDMMVCCSVCGTWRHNACGGHYEPYTTRKHGQEKFVPVCVNCHGETQLLKGHPRAEQRLDKQRTEHLRRALATNAVMRAAAYQKSVGLYKWPPGSVDSKHLGPHLRNLYHRFEKVTKQWSDSSNRLNRVYGYRPKERMTIRTKELEKLLGPLEDAEMNMDRHNMIVFLMRDTARDKPVGFENEPRNLFDPAERGDEVPAVQLESDESSSSADVDTLSTSLGKRKVDDKTLCLRKGCTKRRRFDSRFCSDGCGVSVLETDLLGSLLAAESIPPSILRQK